MSRLNKGAPEQLIRQLLRLGVSVITTNYQGKIVRLIRGMQSPILTEGAQSL